MEIRAATPDDIEHAFEVLSRQSRRAFGVSEVAREHVAQSLGLASTDGFVARHGFASLDATQTLEIASIDDATSDALYGAVAERAAERGFDRLHAVVARGDTPFDSLVRRAGFEHHGDVLRMWRSLDGDLPAPAWPDAVAVRTYDNADAHAVHALLDDAYRAWDETYVSRSHDDWLAWMTSHDDFDPALWFLAERDGELLACALHWREHQLRGWVKDIAVRADARGNGLAKALLHHGFRAYDERGAERVGLKVEAANPTGALQLYERTGFVTDQRYGIWVKVL